MRVGWSAISSAALAASAIAGALFCGVPAHAADSTASVYTCVDARGRRLTSDRPLLECLDREQRVLNKDGSQRQVLPPSMTADERAAAEEAEHRRQAELAAKQEAVRRDRNLLARYPNQTAHDRARAAALDDVRKAVKLSEHRLAEMEAERKPLLDEAEFYQDKPLPAKLKTKLEFIDVTVNAQKTLVQNQQAEIGRINAVYDAELERLKKLWAGTPPGSLAPMADAPAPAPGIASKRKP